jgi:ubiquinone/menaquinone biosynthesis C-methylase UbiE
MLDMIVQELDVPMAVGLDRSATLLRFNTNPELHLIQGDASHLPFCDETFDAVIATAVVEHVSDIDMALIECHRILKKDGICVITTPVPFFEKIGARVIKGYIRGVKTLGIKELKSLLESNGFGILKAEKFMLSPYGFPFDIKIEKVMKLLKLDFLLLNRLLVGRKA